MSSLSFARIMYGVSQEQPSHTALPLSSSSSHFSAVPNAPQRASEPAPNNESLLHKAWHALIRHS